MKQIKFFLIAVLFVLPALLFADMPVIDRSLDPDNGYASTSDSMTIEQRVMQLERQMQYLQQMSLSSKLSQLQQTIQALRGELEMQAHQLQKLEKQQRTFYSDLDKRIAPPGDETPQPVVETVKNTQTETATDSEQNETQAYQAAFTLIKNKLYSQAISAFEAYLKKYPTSQYVPNVHYWLGEVYAISGDTTKAINALTVVVNQYAKSNKAPDAMLALGSLYYDQSEWQQAKEWWQKVVSKYPNSGAARIAKQRLVQIQREGH